MTCAEDASNGSNVLSEVTAELINAMARPDSNKTYIALVRGEGILHDRDFRKEGWFMVDRPIKDERGMLHNATTWFRFVAGQDNDRGKRTDRARASVVLCRPVTGRWHQIRKHLNSLSHPILGDSSHGSSRTNREWKESRGMLPERTCLHLARIQLGPANLFPGGIDVECPLAEDMLRMLKEHTPSILDDVRKALLLEGIHLPC
jgi:23S rRNA-/tRNA-specific pseudouridylate synthase